MAAGKVTSTLPLKELKAIALPASTDFRTTLTSPLTVSAVTAPAASRIEISPLTFEVSISPLTPLTWMSPSLTQPSFTLDRAGTCTRMSIARFHDSDCTLTTLSRSSTTSPRLTLGMRRMPRGAPWDVASCPSSSPRPRASTITSFPG